jgi:hypothetical protein
MLNNKSSIIFFLYAFNYCNGFGQIQWTSENSLKWNNFKGTVLKNDTEFKAFAFSSVECEYGNHDTCIYYTVRSIFDENKSWYTDTSAELLQHEKGHFNISEIYARRIRKFLQENLQKDHYESEIRSGIDSLQGLNTKYQALYDIHTNHGKDMNAQKLWQLTIEKQLKQLDNYEICEYDNCKDSTQ